MSLQHLPLAKITEADLQRLVSEAICESRLIEYKRDWPSTNDADKREFLADIASFANAGGGDLLYGIDARDGMPLSLVGLGGFVPDTEQLRVEQLLARWISPRLAGISFATVPLAAGNVVFIIRIPRSFSAPHMVTFNDYNRFFSRHSTGKYMLDVNELRAAFLQSARAADRIRDYRLERVSRIAAGEVGVKLWSRVCIVWHLMPLSEWSGFDYEHIVNIESTFLRPMGAVSGWGEQINLDGCMIRSTLDQEGTVVGYVQVFRNGCIEAVMPDAAMAAHKAISPSCEGTLRSGLIRYRRALHALGIVPPYFVALSLVNVEGFKIDVPNGPFARSHRQVGIDRSHLLLPEVAVDSEATPIDAIVRPLFDLVWNACGYLRSPNYGPDGKWCGGSD